MSSERNCNECKCNTCEKNLFVVDKYIGKDDGCISCFFEDCQIIKCNNYKPINTNKKGGAE